VTPLLVVVVLVARDRVLPVDVLLGLLEQEKSPVLAVIEHYRPVASFV
jgi:hypothetical protein